MEFVIVLNFGQGHWKTGFPSVFAQLWEPDHPTPMQFSGSLPAIPEFVADHQRWRSHYSAIYAHLGLRRLPDFDIEEDDNTRVSLAEFNALCQTLQRHLNQWLSVASFQSIERSLRTRLSPQDAIRLIIVADNLQVLQLPWNLWDFLTDYAIAEIAISLSTFARSTEIIQIQPKPHHETVKILSILGNANGIEIDRDRQLLQQLPNAEIKWLIEPTLQAVQDQLWQSEWNILFFAGHSDSRKKGCIQINQTDTITVEQLKYGLRNAIAHGLKLAIFNSCDGLGLAHDLADLQLTQTIVMRELVPDRVAQDFLKHFLSGFAQDKSLYVAVREAREKLQSLEGDFPCATWLPVICQNPAEVPSRWSDWVAPRPSRFPRLTRSQTLTIAQSSLVVTLAIVLLRGLGLMQPLELQTFDRLMQFRPPEPPDSRLLIVRIDEEDIEKQNAGSLSDATLDRLLEILSRYHPRVIGLDLYRDFPTQNSSLQQRLEQLTQRDQLIAVCKRPDPMSRDLTGVAPPPNIRASKIGFSDFVQDEDSVIRRHLLFVSPKTIATCTTPYALSVQLAFRYLAAEPSPILPTFTPERYLKLASTTFLGLSDRVSGYQQLDARGSQVLLNYRSLPPQTIAQQVTVRQILSGQMNLEAIRDRVVLIGMTAPSSGDSFATPYGKSFPQRVPGVLIHAQMVSQMLSAVLDRRPLLWVWPSWVEVLWIGSGSLVGGLIAWRFRHARGFTIALLFSSGVVMGVSYCLLISGGWIPLVPTLGVMGLTACIVAYRFTIIKDN